MNGGHLLTFAVYQFVGGFGFLKHKMALKTPLMANKFSVPTNCKLDMQLVAGAALFGAGWGIGMLFPGPAALCHAAIGNTNYLGMAPSLCYGIASWKDAQVNKASCHAATITANL